jgi:hypothetical protein
MVLPPLTLPIGGASGAVTDPCAKKGAMTHEYNHASTRDAFASVLWRHKRGMEPNSERASTWTHGVAAAAWIAYAIGRALVAPKDTSLGTQLHIASIATFALTYGVSTAFHIYKTIESWAPWMRTADFSAVYLGLAVNGVTAVAIVGEDGRDTPFETWLDPLLAPVVLFVFFLVRRLLVDYDETYLADTVECEELPHRVWHSDLEHVTLRHSGSFALVYGWVLLAPTASLTLGAWLASLWVAAALASSLVLTFGGVLLAGLLGDGGRVACCSVGAAGGAFCYMDEHAWWHIVACTANALMIVVREVVLAYR